MTVDYRRLKLNSDIPTDLVVLILEGEGDATSSWPSYSITFDHGLPFTPLVFGLYSLDGGATWNDLVFDTTSIVMSVSANSQSVTVQAVLLGEYANSHIKWRVFGFAPTATTTNIAPPKPLSRFYIDSRNEYDSLVMAGSGIFSPLQNLSQTVATHNLGYIPRVMLWAEKDGSTAPVKWSNNYIANPLCFTADERLVSMLYWGDSNDIRLHYRIYGRDNA